MQVVALIITILNYVFVVYSLLYTLYLTSSVVVGSFCLYDGKKKRRYHDYYLDEVKLPISIIVPAYNEEVTIVDSINSLLKLDYSTYEIIIVDDGSKDKTSETVIAAFQMHKVEIPIQRVVPSQPDEFTYKTFAYKVPITLVRKRNGGSKADANNMGINACNYPYFLDMDADSVLQSDSLQEIAIPVLEDENTVAVGGAIRILNDTKIRDGKIIDYQIPHNPLAAFQSMEYDRSFLLSRLFFDKFNGNLNVSGAFGLFRKDLVVKVGGYDQSSFGEDMDLVMNIHQYCHAHKIPYKVRYAPNAVCWTQAPETFKDIYSQRNRWHIGLRQALKKYHKMILSPRYGAVGLFTIPAYILFEALSPFVEVIGFISIVVASCMGLSNWVELLTLTGIFAAFGIFLSMISYVSRAFTLDLKINVKDFFKVLGICLLELVFFHPYFLAIRFMAAFKSTKKRRPWKSLARKKID